jgi:hypothetical protein
MVPKSRAIIVVEKNRTALYWGFLQYDRFCFQRHAKHCVKKDLECLVGKQRAPEPAGGVLSSCIKALFLLCNVNIKLQLVLQQALLSRRWRLVSYKIVSVG